MKSCFKTAYFLCLCLFLFGIKGRCCDEQTETKVTYPPPITTFIPDLNMTECGNNTVCKDVFNYPEDYVLKLFVNNNTKYNHYFDEDKIDTDIVNRFMELDKTLCDSIVHLEEPKAGKNKNDEWMFIVNHGDYKQAVEIRICTNENASCNMDENFPYKTECRQKYILRKMLALDPKDGQLKEETIKLPSCCTCRYFEKKINK